MSAGQIISCVVVGAVCFLGVIFIIICNTDFPYSNHKDYADSCGLNARLTFEDFLSYYKLAPKEWHIGPYRCGHWTEDGGDINIVFSHKDFRAYWKWYKQITDPTNRGQEELLKQVQEDIDDVKKKLAEEKKKAEDEIQKLTRRQLGG